MGVLTALDFQRPVPPQTINGVPIVARKVSLPSGKTVWVPQGISRTADNSGWYICIAHQGGVSEQNVLDGGRSDLESLPDALKTLITTYHWKDPDQINDHRYWTSNRRQDDPYLSTGYTGVTVARKGANAKRRAKVVEIHLNLHYKDADERIRVRSVYQSGVSESLFLEDPDGAQALFEEQLAHAIAIRRHDEVLAAQGGIASRPLTLADLPAHAHKLPCSRPELRLADIFDSFIVAPLHTPVTTGGNPETLAAKLQSLDLTNPQKTVFLEGRKLTFVRQVIEGQTFYLPQGLYRARGEWRIRIYHAGGVVNEAVPDADWGNDVFQSLRSAQILFVSECRALDCTKTRVRATRNPVLDSCVEGLVIAPMRRVRKSGEVSWAFSVKVLQKVNGAIKGVTVFYGPIETIKDWQIREALCRGTSLVRYREALQREGRTSAEAIINSDTEVPKTLVPDEPVHTITADDLWYHIEQVEASQLPGKRKIAR